MEGNSSGRELMKRNRWRGGMGESSPHWGWRGRGGDGGLSFGGENGAKLTGKGSLSLCYKYTLFAVHINTKSIQDE